MSALRVLLSIVVVIFGVLPLTYPRFIDWEYHMESFHSNSTNEEVFTDNLRIIRKGKGEYGLNGTITVGTELTDEYFVKVTMLRSSSGSSQYTVFPMKMPNTTVYGFLNDHYKKLFMKDIEHCSNMPTFEGTWNQPVEPKEYFLNKCFFSTDNMPSHMESGYYKLIFQLTGPKVAFMGEMVLHIISTLTG